MKMLPLLTRVELWICPVIDPSAPRKRGTYVRVSATGTEKGFYVVGEDIRPGNAHVVAVYYTPLSMEDLFD